MISLRLGKKMAIAGTGDILPTYTPNQVQRKQHFWNICHCANNIVYPRFESFRMIWTFLWALLKISCVIKT